MDILLLVLLIILGHVYQSAFLYGAIIIAIYILLKADGEKAFCFILFLIPNIRIFDDLGVTYVVNLLMGVPCLKYIVCHLKNINVFAFISTIGLLVYELLHTLLYENYSNILPMISGFLGMFFCISITLEKKIYLKMERIWKYFAGGVLFSALVYLLVNPAYAMNIVQYVVSNNRLKAYANDPNYFSLYICICVAIIYMQGKIARIHQIGLILLMILGLMTGSKMSLITLVIVSILGIGYNLLYVKNKKKKSFYFGIFSLVIISAVIFSEKLLMLFENFLARAGFDGTNLDMSKLTSSRSTIAMEYIEILKDDVSVLLFGRGFEYYNVIGEQIAHNTYLDVILSWGLVGILWLGVILLFWMNSLRVKYGGNVRLIACLPLFVIGIDFLVLSCLNASMFWWIISVGYIASINNRTEKNYLCPN